MLVQGLCSDNAENGTISLSGIEDPDLKPVCFSEITSSPLDLSLLKKIFSMNLHARLMRMGTFYFSSMYLKVLISQSKLSGTRKVTLKYK